MRQTSGVWLTVLLVLAGLPAALTAAAAPPPAAPEEPAAEAPAAEGEAPEGEEDGEATVLDLLIDGGPLMIPIGFCSFLMVAFTIERALSLRRKRILPPDFVLNMRAMVANRPLERGKILDYCQAHPSPIARIFEAAVKRLHRPIPEIEKTIEDAGAKEVRGLRRNTRVLAGVASVAPLLGLLGTVLGMIGAFQELGSGQRLGAGAGGALAENIHEALVTTAAGLSVAIPSLVIYLLILARIERLVAEMDDMTMEFVEAVAEREHQEAP
jgi:biopolymer transport protein ExbB